MEQTAWPPPSCAEGPAASTDRSAGFSPAVVAATYNNASFLESLLDRMIALGLPVIVVNDGSTDATEQILVHKAAGAPPQRLSVVTHARNRGKAAALRTGFEAARRLGCSHAITIDTDGQHEPEEIGLLADAAEKAPRALILGVRRKIETDCPRLNRLGWWMSALGIWLQTGVRVLDSQCGLRAYPLAELSQIRVPAQRFGFEAEVVTRALWAGWPLAEVPITCHYFQDERRVSHFRPWIDGVRAFFMHARLTLGQLAPKPSGKAQALQEAESNPKECSAGEGNRPINRPAMRSTPEGERGSGTQLEGAGWFERISPIGLWGHLREDHFKQLHVAAALGIGSFLAALPLGGWQIALALYVAWRLHLHWIPTVLASLLCFWPTGPWIGRASIEIGHLLCHARPVAWDALEISALGHWRMLAQWPMAWPLGGLVVGFFLSWIVLFLFVQAFRIIPVRQRL